MKKVLGFGLGYLDIIAINNNVYTYQPGGTAFNIISNLQNIILMHMHVEKLVMIIMKNI